MLFPFTSFLTRFLFIIVNKIFHKKYHMLNQYVYMFRGAGLFALCWRPIGGFLMFIVLWWRCCLFDTFPVFILNFMTLKITNSCIHISQNNHYMYYISDLVDIVMLNQNNQMPLWSEKTFKHQKTSWSEKTFNYV